MKVCPNCKTEYSDDLEICPADETVLLDSDETTGAETLSAGADSAAAASAGKNSAQQSKKGSTAPMVDIKSKNAAQAKSANTKLYAFLAILLLLAGIGGYYLYSKGSSASTAKNGLQSGELVDVYKKLYAAVKSKDSEQIKQMMSKNSIAFAEFAGSQQKKPLEQVLENGFTATTFAESLPKMRDERIKDDFGALEVWNEKTKIWEDLPFIKEDGAWKLAIGDMFKGSYQKPALGQAIKEQEEANKVNPNLIPQQPPMNANSLANTNAANVNTIQVQPIKPALEKRKAK